MKQLLGLLATLASLTAFSQDQPYFLSTPSLSPDGQTAYFSFEGDIWKASVTDGQATRLTAMQGYESNPIPSPDGKWIAFTGRQFGNADVYVMSVQGGDIKQLTWHSAQDELTGWSWDSKSIYFNSARASRQAGYKVSLDGNTPNRVFGSNFFQYDHGLVEHPDGSIFFSDTWESNSQAQRKRYKGPFNPDIQSYNLKTKQHKKYTSWEGKDFGVTIDRKGSIYFISDEANGEYNLYTITNGQSKSLTKFSTSIKSPFVNANGGKIIFEKEYQLWIYDVNSAKASKLTVQINRNSILPKEKDFNIRSNISAFDVSPDGKKIVFVSRGELFVSDIEGKFIREIQRGSAERVSEVNWASDSRTILFSQTWKGYSNWYSISADGSKPLKQITSDLSNDRDLVLNKKRDKAVYLSGRNEVKLIDMKTFESKTIAKEEIWGFQNSSPGFSPNDEYVLFTAIRNFEQDIFLHHIKDNKTFNLTNTGITESGPIWSPDGKYIYFTSQRLKPSYPFGMQQAKVYRLPLQKIDEPYRSEKLDDLFKEEKKDTSKKETAKKDSAQKTPAVATIKIDMERIMERIEQVSPSFGTQFLAHVYQKGDKTSVVYVSNHAEGKMSAWKTVIEPFEDNKTERIAGTEGGFASSVIEANDKLYVLVNGTIGKLSLDLNRVDPVSMNFVFRRNLSAEFNQMLEEAWAQMEENFYDDKFHGIDWKKTKTYYQQFLPYLNNRADLRILLNDMLGELNSSHQGFGTFGDDEAVALSNRTMETGIVFEENDPYKVKYVVARSSADKSSIDIQPGDKLVAVNGQTINPSTCRDIYFTLPSLDNELSLTFTRAAVSKTVKVHPQPTMLNNLYDEWIDKNQQRVDEKSKGRIAYGYMKNMGQGELEQFIVDMTKELNSKDALIFDLRYNTGGNVHDEVLKFLSQRSYLQWQYRDGQKTIQSNFAPADKPIVLLINEQSLSDAEMTSQGFKALKLGTIVGNGTYRWIIFTSGVQLVDGSAVRMPSWGCYTLDGKDLEVTGVQPDILVINSFQDKLEGRDPQLDRAIEVILGKLK